MTQSVGILIPTFNRWDILSQLLERLGSQFRTSSSVDSSVDPSVATPLNSDQDTSIDSWEVKHLWIVIINDGGIEPGQALVQLLSTIKQKWNRNHGFSTTIHILTLPTNQGQQIATLSGLQFLLSQSNPPEFIITIDDDGGHPPEMVPAILALLERQGPAGLVYGYPHRRPNRSQIHRSTGTKLNTWLFQRYLGLPKGIQVGSFRGFTREIARAALEVPVTFPYLSAMLLTAGAQVDAIQWGYQQIQHQEAESIPTRSKYSIWSLALTYFKLLVHWGPFTFLLKLKRNQIQKPFFQDQNLVRIQHL
jgi:glycosyltransferase involved in cell wall biosynthesis